MPRGVEGSLTLGNHYLHQGEDGHRAAMYELKTIFLAHYPVRSITQINKKIEFISNLFKDLDKELAHQTRTYEKIETLENLIDKAIVYSTNDSETKHKFKVVLDPLINKNNNG